MANNQGGNPWGAPNPGGGSSRPQGPDFSSTFNKFGDNFRQKFGGGSGGFGGKPQRNIMLLVLGIVAIWFFTGFYRVEQGQVGVELVFGKIWGSSTEPGLNYNFPSPIGEVLVVSVERTRKTEVGYREVIDNFGASTGRRNLPEESLMLTTDQNIVDVEYAVFWRVGDPVSYLFNIRDPESTIKLAAESAMREVVGTSNFDDIVTEEKRQVGDRVAVVLQEYLDGIISGVNIQRVDFQKTEPPQEVIDSFNDVQRARQDLDRLRNQAEAYRNSLIPEARGQVEQVLRQAEGYRERLVQEAEGEAQRFIDIYGAYRESPKVTRRRMYLEAVTEVLTKSNKILIDPSSNSSGVVPFLPLDSLRKSQ